MVAFRCLALPYLVLPLRNRVNRVRVEGAVVLPGFLLGQILCVGCLEGDARIFVADTGYVYSLAAL